MCPQRTHDARASAVSLGLRRCTDHWSFGEAHKRPPPTRRDSHAGLLISNRDACPVVDPGSARVERIDVQLDQFPRRGHGLDGRKSAQAENLSAARGVPVGEAATPGRTHGAVATHCDESMAQAESRDFCVPAEGRSAPPSAPFARKQHSRRRLPGVALAWERDTVLRSMFIRPGAAPSRRPRGPGAGPRPAPCRRRIRPRVAGRPARSRGPGLAPARSGARPRRGRRPRPGRGARGRHRAPPPAAARKERR
jgi:hypothetical protein